MPQRGRPSVKVDMVPSLIVINAHGATLERQTLTLAGISPNAIDIIGLPFMPLSVAGVARRTARRAYRYGAAAAAYPYPYPPYYPPPPYYYPYPP